MNELKQLGLAAIGITLLILTFTLLWEAGKFVRKMAMKFIDWSWDWIGDHPGWSILIMLFIWGAVFCRDEK